ncbi:MAG: methionine--tRNA ligase subunit beta, partial [Syntrophothermus sp.]
DPLRYTLGSNLPETRDTDFYWKEFQAKNNNELADILGNFINRTFIFVHKHFEGKVPERKNLQQIDKDMLTLVESYPEKISVLFENYKLKDGINEMMNLARAGNKYFNDSEPWKSIKADKQKAGNTINVCLQAIYTLAELFYPVIPSTSEKIFYMLNAKQTNWDDCSKNNLPEGHQLNKSEILFTKIEDSMIEEQISKLGQIDEPKVDDTITIDDFMKVQLKTAEVIEAERVPKSEKLIKLKVKLDNEERQVVAGIGKSYSPEEMLGKKIIIVANLKPAKLMGLESKGMLLAVTKEDGSLQVLNVDASVKNGTRAK